VIGLPDEGQEVPVEGDNTPGEDAETGEGGEGGEGGEESGMAEEGAADGGEGAMEQDLSNIESSREEGGGESMEGDASLEQEEGGEGLEESGDLQDSAQMEGSQEESHMEGTEDELAAGDEAALRDSALMETHLDGSFSVAEGVSQLDVDHAVVKIQSLARGSMSRSRVKRIMMGEEDPFADSQRDVTMSQISMGTEDSHVELEDMKEATLTSRQEEFGESKSTFSESYDEEEMLRMAEMKAREERMRLEQEAREQRIKERLEIGKKFSAAQKLREELLHKNAELQKKLAAHFAAKRAEDSMQVSMSEENPDASSADVEHRYFQALRQVADNKAELDKVQLNYDHAVLDMKTRLEQKQEKVQDLKEQFKQTKREVAKSVGSSGGRPVPLKLLNQLEEQGDEKDRELEKVRLKNIHLRNQLRKLEGNLKRKEELSNELHLIDFEQLKIENQTLNEKIEERNEELLKLRKKTTTTVQVLTHLKEKLQFVQAENQLLKVELAELEADLSTHRDALTKAKHDRDNLRSENQKLRGEAGLIGNNELLRDFDRRKKEIVSMQDHLEQLKERHRTLREQILTISQKKR